MEIKIVQLKRKNEIKNKCLNKNDLINKKINNNNNNNCVRRIMLP